MGGGETDANVSFQAGLKSHEVYQANKVNRWWSGRPEINLWALRSHRASHTGAPCQTSAQMAYFLQHRHRLLPPEKRLLRQTSQALCRQRDRQTKEWKWLHSRKGLVVLYLHYQAQEINSHLRKVKRPPEKTEQLTVISFFSFSLPPFMSIISHLAWSSWWSLIAAMNAMNFMRFLYFLPQ